MVKEVIWTPQAQITFNRVIDYLEEKWTEREIVNFIKLTDKVIEYIAQNPKMFRRTGKRNVYEALVTPYNLLIYKVYPNSIYLITFWDTRRNPKKKRY
jgi:plasmid stabilization system protein ParE